MEELMKGYENIANEEQGYHRQITTVEICLNAIFDCTSLHKETINKLTVESMVVALHNMEIDLRVELLHLRLEKAWTERKSSIEPKK